ncbi:hypothetical protein [Acrocarpospora sp. B8E8]|uniref:hypothetical protein n=1 Tax=Acrocarpospora sp. B8E8 TaxID=3153572 RepID=UPI00325DF2FB
MTDYLYPPPDGAPAPQTGQAEPAILDTVIAFVSANPVGSAILAVFALVAIAITLFALRALYRSTARLLRVHVAPRPPEDILTVVAASIATGVSAQGMWRFSGDVLGFDGPLQLLLFAFIEVAVITSAVRARRNMRENFSAGVDGLAVWALTCLSAVLSAMDARSLPEALFRLAAPLVAAWLWERGMAIERHRISGRQRIHWRLTPERVLVRWGLADASDRTASDVDAQRRLIRFGLAIERTRTARTGLGKALARRRYVKTRDAAVRHAQFATSDKRKAELVDILAALLPPEALAQLRLTGWWTQLKHPALPASPDPEVVEAASQEGRAAVSAFEKWSSTWSRIPSEAVARLVATAPVFATGRATGWDGAGLPADPFGAQLARSLWPVADVVAIDLFGRPVARPDDDRAGGRVGDLADGDVPVAEPVADEGDPRPDPRPADDRKRPNEQDRRRVVRVWVNQVKKGNVLSKRELADRSGFRETWCLERIREGREQMIAEGWTFPEDGPPVPPVAELVAVATGPESP